MHYVLGFTILFSLLPASHCDDDNTDNGAPADHEINTDIIIYESRQWRFNRKSSELVYCVREPTVIHLPSNMQQFNELGSCETIMSWESTWIRQKLQHRPRRRRGSFTPLLPTCAPPGSRALSKDMRLPLPLCTALASSPVVVVTKSPTMAYRLFSKLKLLFLSSCEWRRR